MALLAGWAGWAYGAGPGDDVLAPLQHAHPSSLHRSILYSQRYSSLRSALAACCLLCSALLCYPVTARHGPSRSHSRHAAVHSPAATSSIYRPAPADQPHLPPNLSRLGGPDSRIHRPSLRPSFAPRGLAPHRRTASRAPIVHSVVWCHRGARRVCQQRQEHHAGQAGLVGCSTACPQRLLCSRLPPCHLNLHPELLKLSARHGLPAANACPRFHLRRSRARSRSLICKVRQGRVLGRARAASYS